MDNNHSKGELISKGALGLFVGLSLILAGVWVGRQLHIVWNIWPSTDAVVVRGAVQESLEIPYAKGGMPIHRFTPNVEFRYTVSGRDYTAEIPSVHTADTYAKAAESLARLYAPGSHHPLRYSPRDPRNVQFGTIEIGSVAYAFLLLICGGVLLALGSDLLVEAYSPVSVHAPAEVHAIPPAVLPFPDRVAQKPLAATLVCPSCGMPAKATEATCPHCGKFLRAA